jgi:hypothetical protein
MMKHITTIVFALALLMFGQLSAQERWSSIEKGRMLVGGAFNFQNITVTAGKNLLSGRATPNVGYFILNNFAVGVRSDIDISNGGESQEYRNVIYLHGNLPIANRSSIVLNFGMGYGYRMNQSPIDKNVKLISDGYILNSRLGYAYFLTRNVIFEASANFDQAQLITNFADGIVSESVTTRMAFLMGFQILL